MDTWRPVTRLSRALRAERGRKEGGLNRVGSRYSWMDRPLVRRAQDSLSVIMLEGQAGA